MTSTLKGNQILLTENGQQFLTLKDLLPAAGQLRVLMIAKTPAPVSVDAGHYFQGTQGRMFWNRLKYGLLNWRTVGREDDDLLPNGWGLTDIVKRPRGFGNEPCPAEYRAGASRIKASIGIYRPAVVMFVYKRVLDELLQHAFGARHKSSYGMNSWADAYLGSRTFVFPMPGTPCTREQAACAMAEICAILKP